MQWLINTIFEKCKVYIDEQIAGLDLMPIGSIVMWSGGFGDVPEGWLNCNGENDTIDLRRHFIQAAGSGLAPHTDGGSSQHHHHSNLTHSHGMILGTGLASGTYRVDSTDNALTAAQPTDNIDHTPNFKALVFIQKMFYV